MFSPIQKANYYVHGMKLSIRVEILRELQRLPPTVGSNFIDIKRIEAAKWLSQRVFMKHSQQ